MDDMASRIAHMRSLLPELQSTLQTFTSSPSKFHIVRTVNPTPTPPKTLYILDSSFNPPSVAHLALAKSAIMSPAATDTPPFRLLVLFSTHNADKSPSPASFDQRIAMMTLFAEDLSQELRDMGNEDVSIDIGLTKEPYYTDKSMAISNTSPPAYSSRPIHVHLIGYDTFIRFCNPKYYSDHNPPLSALAAFFNAGHKMRITQRPYNSDDASSKEFGTVQDQEQYLQRLSDGELEKEGFDRTWAERMDMVPCHGIGVSSTRIRTAATEANWPEVGRLCTRGVAEWIKNEGLYAS